MTGLALPIALALLGLFISLNAYRNMQRGGTRYYTLEREALLRRAGFTLLAGIFFLVAAVALLIYNQQQMRLEQAAESGQMVEGIPTATATLSIFPPTEEPSATPDLSQPTATATPILRRGVVDGTGGNGLYLRDTPGGAELAILPDGAIVTLLDEQPVESGSYVWLKVRTVAGEEGWVVQDFLIVRDR